MDIVLPLQQRLFELEKDPSFWNIIGKKISLKEIRKGFCVLEALSVLNGTVR